MALSPVIPVLIRRGKDTERHSEEGHAEEAETRVVHLQAK